MALKASSLEVLRIIVSIGGVETNHFSLWHDKAGNAVAQPLAGVTDPETGVTFPDLNAKGGELNQTNLILPEPCDFLHRNLPQVSIVRPTLDRNGGAVAAIKGFTADRLSKANPRSSSAPSTSSRAKQTLPSANSADTTAAAITTVAHATAAPGPAAALPPAARPAARTRKPHAH
jgi:hypothetical protein